ncbi:MAG: hypothetical protein A2Y63_00255 [Candidatus Riflebacteria bacterium RBG_13_59_9]|nr:MAG: hypothetical protein A2Y63_00255 [Candidatus Riflebacteria bacterium RBG_13_59_9]
MRPTKPPLPEDDSTPAALAKFNASHEPYDDQPEKADQPAPLIMPKLEVLFVRLPCGCPREVLVIRTNRTTDIVDLPSHTIAPDLFCLPQRGATNHVAGYLIPTHWLSRHLDHPDLQEMAERLNADEIRIKLHHPKSRWL